MSNRVKQTIRGIVVAIFIVLLSVLVYKPDTKVSDQIVKELVEITNSDDNSKLFKPMDQDRIRELVANLKADGFAEFAITGFKVPDGNKVSILMKSPHRENRDQKVVVYITIFLDDSESVDHIILSNRVIIDEKKANF